MESIQNYDWRFIHLLAGITQAVEKSDLQIDLTMTATGKTAYLTKERDDGELILNVEDVA